MYFSFPSFAFFIPLMSIPSGASAAVLQPSDPVPDTAVSVEGPNFDNPLSLQEFIGSYERIGFQANSLGRAIDIVNKMVRNMYVLYSHINLYSVNGVSPMNHWPTTSRKSINPLKLVTKYDATYFLATPPTSSPPGSEKSSSISSNTSTSLLLSLQPAESKKTSSNASARRTLLISTSMVPIYVNGA